MCRLLARLGPVASIEGELIGPSPSLRSLAVDHADGWGIARWHEGTPVLAKAPTDARSDATFAGLAATLREDALLVHVRDASIGDALAENTHPFAFGPWAFAHNGTLFGLEAPARERHLATLPPPLRANVRGATDSELAFHLILAALLRECGTVDVSIAKAAPIVAREAARLFDGFAGSGDEPPAANFALGNGHGFIFTKLGQDLAWRVADGATCIASERVGPARDWRRVPERSLVIAEGPGKLDITPLQ